MTQLTPLCSVCLEVTCECPGGNKTLKPTKAAEPTVSIDDALANLKSTISMADAIAHAEDQTMAELLDSLAAANAGLTPEAKVVLKGPGRGPTGKLRNFGAMGDGKLVSVVHQLGSHMGTPLQDDEAYRAAKAEADSRGLYDSMIPRRIKFTHVHQPLA